MQIFLFYKKPHMTKLSIRVIVKLTKLHLLVLNTAHYSKYCISYCKWRYRFLSPRRRDKTESVKDYTFTDNYSPLEPNEATLAFKNVSITRK